MPDPGPVENADASTTRGKSPRWLLPVLVVLAAAVILVLFTLHSPITLRGLLAFAGLLLGALVIFSVAIYRRRSQDKGKVPATVIFNVTLFLVAGLTVVSFCTWTSARTWAAGIMWSLACLGLGSAAGFLFGIPRSRVPGTAAQQAAAVATPASGNESSPIEQISDWLTKIIVGLGLINLTKIPEKLYAWAGYVSCGLDTAPGPCPSSNAGLTSFALGIILYFSVLGLVSGYLLTQIFLLAYVNLMSAPGTE